MATRRRYTARERAKATGIAVVEGVTEAERQTGIPKQTIDYWTNKPEFRHLRTTARELVIDQFWVGMQIGLEQVVAGLKGDAPLHHKADALRTIADRYALLTGAATSRTEERDITGSITDTELMASIRSAEALVRGQAEGADTPEGERV